ncbi:LTA synthase family protein [Alcaligenes parafaecalis]|uniref:LTA synthase family protein n=1 Tax=Alcaligenes parafaecalis TaxID=171260 RepID=A0ABT3VKT8_9BURK|nr:LTA synthase family protein [Alcaligenes parafaecalis]MCX5464132.1 LTA synthase family protein [Alcaligenes parafaecalis]
MTLEPGFWTVILAAVSGLALTVGLERFLQTAASLRRPAAAWALHVGLYGLAYVVLVFVLGRPIFATALLCAFFLLLVVVSNAKFKALREAFVFQDYEYFTDAIRHPRLYIPFLGWGKFFLAAAGFIAALTIGLWLETVPALRAAWTAQWGALALLFVLSMGLLLWGNSARLAVQIAPEQDVQALGLLASFWRYWQQGRQRPTLSSPFVDKVPQALSGAKSLTEQPHLVSVQSESFFDARRIWDGIRPEILAEFDRFKSQASACGHLHVPAWGANTVRSEFSFLSGIENTALGVHRFNPYRAVCAGWSVATLASWLKNQGYRTICIHPYPASFYQRNRVFPLFGFDEFLDIKAFGDVERTGPYIGDQAVADKVASVLEQAQGPVFIHVITMENHGPLHLEKVAAGDMEKLYRQAPPAACEDLTIYLRHIRNADAMLTRLRQALTTSARPASLCWYGDHVPIMPSVYAALGTPCGDVDYFIWNSTGDQSGALHQDAAIHDLAGQWMRLSGVMLK